MPEPLKPYPAYKPADVPWLQQVPEHWEVLPNRALFAEVNEAGRPEDEMLSVTIGRGVLKQAEHLATTTKKDSSRKDKSTYKRVGEGDIVYNKMRAWQGAFGMSRYSGIVSPAYVVQRPRPKAVSEFYHYLMRTPLFAKEAERNSYGLASDIWNLRPEHFKGILNVCPPVAEQHLIVRYLHALDAKVKRYIRTKRTLIARLQEQKQAIIQRAVTRGLDPNSKLKPSGVEWLGEVPVHWEMRRMKSLVLESVAGPYGSSLTKAMYVSQGYRVYGQQQVIPDNFRLGDYFITEEKFKSMQRYRVYPGDVLVSVMGTVGRVAVVPEDVEPGIINPRLVRYRPDATTVRARYLQMTMQAPSARGQLTEVAKGTTMEGLNMGMLGRLLLLIPPMNEQDSILGFIAIETTSLNTAIAQSESEIALMQEYHTRLIADVVKGAVDVTAAAKDMAVEAEVVLEEEPLSMAAEGEAEYGEDTEL